MKEADSFGDTIPRNAAPVSPFWHEDQQEMLRQQWQRRNALIIAAVETPLTEDTFAPVKAKFVKRAKEGYAP